MNSSAYDERCLKYIDVLDHLIHPSKGNSEKVNV